MKYFYRSPGMTRNINKNKNSQLLSHVSLQEVC